MDPTTPTLTTNATAAFLAGTAVFQAVVALRAPDSERSKANALGATVCVVAFLHYQWMRGADDAERVRLRYGDWVVTCPLLLAELFFATRQTSAAAMAAVVVASMLMVLLGYAAHHRARARVPLFVVSTLLLIFVAWRVVAGARVHRELVAYFFALWALYPVAFWAGGAAGNAAFDVLDALSKGLFGLLVGAAAS